MLGALGLLLLAWVLLPLIVEAVIEGRLSKRLEADVEVGDVDLDLLSPGIVVRETTFALDERTDVELPEVTVAWSWRSLLQERPTIEVSGPRVRIHIVPGERPEPPPSSDSNPLSRFESLRVVGGTVNVVLETESRPVDIELSDLAFELRNTAPRAFEQTTRFELSGRVGERGHFEAEGSMAPVEPQSNWSVEFSVDAIDLVPLNPLWKAMIEMDASQGELSLNGEVSKARGRLRGRIVPEFTSLRLLGAGETARHPMGEALFSEMLSGASNAMTFDRRTDEGDSGGLEDLIDTDWEAVVEGVIRRGYQRQLDTLTGYVSSIGGVDVSFAQGRLVLHDVAISRDTGLVQTPFIAVKALEVMFDESVPKPGVESFKHVVLREPVLTFVAHEEEDRRQMQFDPQWPAKVSSLPFQTQDLRVENGTIRFIEHRGEQVEEISIDEVTLDGRQMAKVLSVSGQRGASIEASGLALGATPMNVTVQYEPASQQGNIHFELEVGPLPLAKLNPLARTHAEIDASAGTVALEAMFDNRAGRVAAEVRLDVSDVELIGEDEESIEHPLREFTLGTRIRDLDGKTLRVEFSRDFDSGLLAQFARELLGEVMEEG